LRVQEQRTNVPFQIQTLDLLRALILSCRQSALPSSLTKIEEALQHACHGSRDWIGFYRTRCSHQALGMKTPADAFALAA
jgi:transposase InsO family protein